MTKTRSSRRSFAVRAVLAVGLAGCIALGGGCNDAQSGALLGAGIGALAGQAIGHDTGSTLIGTAVGAGAGYVVGNESDKAKQPYRRYQADCH
jgi:uncharacterized protein YcfJ